MARILFFCGFVRHLGWPDKEPPVTNARDGNVLHLDGSSGIQVFESGLQGSLNELEIRRQRIFDVDLFRRPAAGQALLQSEKARQAA